MKNYSEAYQVLRLPSTMRDTIYDDTLVEGLRLAVNNSHWNVWESLDEQFQLWYNKEKLKLSEN